MAADTTDPSYWLNWRFLVSALFVLGTMIFSLFLIWKYEGAKRLGDERREYRQAPVGVLYKDELWKTCLTGIHPIWLLFYRIIAFGVLLALLIGNTVVDGFGIFFFYTQWTFLLTTVYFGLATAFSLYGFGHDGACRLKIAPPNIDAEQGSNGAPNIGGRWQMPFLKDLSSDGEVHVRQTAGCMGYFFQTVYQVSAGAVVLTDVVFWLVLYPFVMAKNTRLAFFDVSMHSVNFLILGDAILNCMRFPMFRIGYFILYTLAFVICQWIIHACVSMKWPYPFMDLSPPYSPAWYAGVGLLHIPCYGFFALIVKLKNLWLSRSFSDAYQGVR